MDTYTCSSNHSSYIIFSISSFSGSVSAEYSDGETKYCSYSIKNSIVNAYEANGSTVHISNTDKTLSTYTITCNLYATINLDSIIFSIRFGGSFTKNATYTLKGYANIKCMGL